MEQFVQDNQTVLIIGGVLLLIFLFRGKIKSLLAPPRRVPSNANVPAPPPTPDPIDMMLLAKRAEREATEIEAARIELKILSGFRARKEMREKGEAINTAGVSECEAINSLVRHAQECPTPAAGPGGNIPAAK